MIDVTIPGYKKLKLSHLVMDYNGTMACDGKLIEGVKELLCHLYDDLEVHILTADTFGSVQKEVKDLKVRVSIIPVNHQDRGKLDYINALGAEQTACIGNGRNDALMLKSAGLGIALVQDEGASGETLLAADIVCKDILSALNLFIHPKRLVATLRS